MTLLAMTPAALWFECSCWFLGNDIPLSFTWSKFYTIGALSVFAAIGIIFGWRHLKRKPIKQNGKTGAEIMKLFKELNRQGRTVII